MVRGWPVPALGANRLREKRHSTRIARGSGEGSEGGRNVADHAERRGVETYAPEVPAKNLPPIEYKDMPEPYFTSVYAIEKVPELLGFG
jgi:hypothetical protein